MKMLSKILQSRTTKLYKTILSIVMALAMLLLIYKFVCFLYLFMHPHLVRYPFYCERINSSMRQEQIRKILIDEGLDVLVQVEENRESWWITTNQPFFSQASFLGGVDLIFINGKYYSANEITFV